jgi:hypothetical protein
MTAYGSIAQPNIQHSIYIKEKFCPEPYNPGYIFYLKHSKGGVYATRHGYVAPLPGYTQVFQKVNANFDTLFTVSYNAVDETIAEKILELPNGNILIAGRTQRDDGGIIYNNKPGRYIWMIEVDTLGNFVKKRTFGSWGSSLTDASITSDGYILLAGNSYANSDDFAHVSNGSADFAWIAKYDTAFNKVWIKIYDNNGNDGNPTIKEILPNRYMIGYMSDGIDTGAVPAETRGKLDLIVYYTDSSANILWKHRYGTPELDAPDLSVVDPVTKDVYFLGSVGSISGGDLTHFSGTCWIHKVDTFGNIKGSKAYGAATDLTHIQDAIWYENRLWGVANSQGEGGDMDLNTGISGCANAWIAVIDSNVNLVGKFTLQSMYNDYIKQLFVFNNSLHISGGVLSTNTSYKCDTANQIQFVFNLGLAPLGIEEVGKVNEKLFDIFPNPTSNTLNLKINEKYIGNTANIVIYSLEGHTVFRNDYSAISAIETIETKEWLSGTYIALLSFYNTKPYQISFTKQ